MAVSDEILATYRGPGRVLRRMLGEGADETRALGYLLAGLVLAFVARWPALSRAAHLDPAQPLVQRAMAAFLATLALLPAFYLVAGLSRIVARALGGHGSGYGARLALFWAFLAAAPLMLLHGIVSGFLGAGPGVTLFGVLVFAAFLWIWISGLLASERGAVA
ncbi:MAG: YIP1 family protein [Defluviimonas sp.]|uniref:YIP1 family protein n=1 Tax=Albidovulum sp. TaxID=1872424 RepID=UPI002A347591|nr:YIP1 family protein [Defluviimonas sp.]